MKKYIYAFNKKTGIPFAIINSIGSGLIVFFSYLTAFSGKAFSYPLSITMGIKTFIINTVVSYQVFAEDNNALQEQEEHSSDSSDELILAILNKEPVRLVNTASSNVFITIASISLLLDLITIYITTYEELTQLSKSSSVIDKDLMKVISHIIAAITSLNSGQFSSVFAIKTWDQIRASDPQDRFKRYVCSFFRCCNSRKNQQDQVDEVFEEQGLLIQNPTFDTSETTLKIEENLATPKYDG